MPNITPSVDNAEHIGPDSTGDNIEAKRSANYIWDGSAWIRQTAASSGGATEYTDGDATSANPVGGIPVFDNAGTITAVSDSNPLPVDATVNASITFAAKSALGTNSSDEASNSSYSNWSTNTWIGTWETNDYTHVAVSLKTDDAGGTMYFDFSNDGGTTTHSTFPAAGFTVATDTHEFHSAVKASRSFRVRFVGSGSRTNFSIGTYYSNSPMQLNSPLNTSMSADNDGVIVKSAHVVQYQTTPSSVPDGDFDTPSITRHKQIRTRDQVSLDLQDCNDYNDFTILGNDTANLADSSNHQFGTGAITFDKVDGAANTVYAGVSFALSSIDIQELFEDGGFVGLGAYLPSLNNVIRVILRLGTDSSNYNEWRWEVADLTASAWNQLRAPTGRPSTYAGNGWDTSDIDYGAVVVQFNSQSNTLAGIVIDNIHLVSGRVTTAEQNVNITSTVTGSKVDLTKVGGNTIDVNSGAVSSGTQRVILATDQPVIPISDNSGSLTVDDGGSSLTVDGTVAVSGTVAVTDNSGSLTVDNATLSTTGGGTETGALRVTIANNSTGVVSVDDNGSTISVDDGGGAITVDGAVTVSNTSFDVNLQDGAGTDITSTGGALDVNIASGSSSGTQYTEGDTDATITGTAMMMEGATNTLVAAQGTAADGLLVNLGSNNDITGTVTANLSATDNAVLDSIDSAVNGTLTVDASGSAVPITDNGGSLTVDGTVAATQSGTWSNRLQDGSGNAITSTSNALDVNIASGSSAGTEYTDGDADATPTGAVAMGTDGTSVYALHTDTSGDLQVDVASSALPSGAATAANQSTANTTLSSIDSALGGTLTVDGSGVTQPVSGTVTANLSTTDNTVLDNIDSNTDFGATTGGGTETGALRVTIANNSTGVLSVDDNGSTLSIDDGGGAITVDGTVTANLSATDNAVLDSIDSAVNGTLTVDGSGSTQPVSGTVTANLGATDNAVLDSIDASTASKYITGISDGRKTVTTGGTAEALASSTACKKVTITAETDNTGLVVVGGSSVVASLATRRGTPLYAGDSMEFDIDNLADVYLDVTVNGEGVTYTYYT